MATTLRARPTSSLLSRRAAIGLVLTFGCGTDPKPDAGSTAGTSTGDVGGTTGEADVTGVPGSDGTSTTMGASSGTTMGLDTTGGSEGSEGSEGSTGEPVDCDALPPLPISYSIVSGPTSSEDFVFDEDGYLLNIANGGDLLHAHYGGVSTLVFPGVGDGFAAGTAMLSNGDVVFNDAFNNRVIRIGRDGSTQIIASGIAYPNGLTVDMDDMVYVAENDGGRVLRVDPRSLSVDTIAQSLPFPNGLAFDPSYENLYVGSFGAGTVHQINIATGDVELFASEIGTGGLDGLIVDECGNVYVTDYGPGVIYRVEGKNHEFVVDLPADWIPNMHFGSGIAGWDASRLYVMDISGDQVFELDLGVQGIQLPQL